MGYTFYWVLPSFQIRPSKKGNFPTRAEKEKPFLFLQTKKNDDFSLKAKKRKQWDAAASASVRFFFLSFFLLKKDNIFFFWAMASHFPFSSHHPWTNEIDENVLRSGHRVPRRQRRNKSESSSPEFYRFTEFFSHFYRIFSALIEFHRLLLVYNTATEFYWVFT